MPAKKKPQKVIITITETERGTITVDATFDPCVNTAKRMTPALQAALVCMQALSKSAKKVTENTKPCTPAT
jgi:hypothetical protein